MLFTPATWPIQAGSCPSGPPLASSVAVADNQSHPMFFVLSKSRATLATSPMHPTPSISYTLRKSNQQLDVSSQHRQPYIAREGHAASRPIYAFGGPLQRVLSSIPLEMGEDNTKSREMKNTLSKMESLRETKSAFAACFDGEGL
uniref:Uncharacterized protein n=1 Tax=Panagrellus redivivus TaxID=6233 RepID=A0A7E4VW76_PANRE